MRRGWEEPKLAVLRRARPEEAVLYGCKVVPDAGATPNTMFDYCYAADACGLCMEIEVS